MRRIKANWQRFKKTVSGNRTVYYIDDSVEVEQVDDTAITRTYIDDVAIVKRTKYAGLSLASHEITYTLRDRRNNLRNAQWQLGFNLMPICLTL